MGNIFLLHITINNKYSDDLISCITHLCSKCLMQRETILLKLMKSIITENIYLRLEPKHKSNMKNVREEELTHDPEGAIKHPIKILWKWFKRESEGQSNTKYQSLFQILSPMTHRNRSTTARWLHFYYYCEGNICLGGDGPCKHTQWWI